MNTITISPFDPVIARDGRPFGYGSGNKMRCLDWPYPSVIAGTLRTIIGKSGCLPSSDVFQDSKILTLLKNMEVQGPLPFYDGNEAPKDIFFPAPKDILVWQKEISRDYMKLRPHKLEEGEGCNIPCELFPVKISQDVKPAKAPAFWSKKVMIKWLTENLENFKVPEKGDIKNGFLDSIEKETRIHVKIDPQSFSSEEQMLFSTESLVIPGGIKFLILAQSTDAKIEQSLKSLKFIHPFGGEHRLSLFETKNLNPLLNCPKEIKESLIETDSIRMVLATPGIFKNGWLPGWLDSNSMTGSPPGLNNIQLKLVGACIERWKAISGWSLEKLPQTGEAGPKPVRRLVPSGSVYFFKLISGKSENLTQIWLKSISDEEQNRKDGFGLPLWGIWKE